MFYVLELFIVVHCVHVLLSWPHVLQLGSRTATSGTVSSLSGVWYVTVYCSERLLSKEFLFFFFFSFAFTQLQKNLFWTNCGRRKLSLNVKYHVSGLRILVEVAKAHHFSWLQCVVYHHLPHSCKLLRFAGTSSSSSFLISVKASKSLLSQLCCCSCFSFRELHVCFFRRAFLDSGCFTFDLQKLHRERCPGFVDYTLGHGGGFNKKNKKNPSELSSAADGCRGEVCLFG